MGKWDTFCQSCGMPMDQDPGHGGTDADGTKNLKYCSYCYQNGKFVDDFQSSKEMMRFVRGKLKEMGLPWWKQWFYSSHIPRLERWKQAG